MAPYLRVCTSTKHKGRFQYSMTANTAHKINENIKRHVARILGKNRQVEEIQSWNSTLSNFFVIK